MLLTNSKHKKQKNQWYAVMMQSVHSGFELSMPFLMIGATALLLNNLPIPAYQELIATVFSGMLSSVFVNIYTYTLGSISLLLCLTVSSSYARITGEVENYLYSATALASYMGFCSNTLNANGTIFDAQWLFTALCITLLSCWFLRISHRYMKFTKRLYTPGASYLYNVALKNLLPILLIVCFFTFAGHVMQLLFAQENITNFGSGLFLRLFKSIDNGLLRTILYVILIHLFWFFGIHGTNVLDSVAREIFEPVMQINKSLIASRQLPTEIFSGNFLNTLVFMGGCGSTLCLAIALLVFSKKKHNRKLAYIVLPSSIFNINEILLFGYPIVFNPVMLIPFLLTPIVLTCVSALVMMLGWVPLPRNTVNWTVPAIVSGYLITGSLAGSILQLCNIIIGVCIYVPFIWLNERRQAGRYKDAVREMEQDAFCGERCGKMPGFTNSSYLEYSYARTLAADLEDALANHELMLYYQPQMYAEDHMYGVEGLLRWKHPVIGFVSPVLILALAAERGIVFDLTYYLMKRMCEDAKKIRSYLKYPIHISINISADHIEKPDFYEKVKEIFADFPRTDIYPVFELTERKIMESSEENYNRIRELKEAGIQFSIDDFGMGHNSITLLQEDLFDEIKLDGSLVSQITANERSREIVSKIIKLSTNLDYRVVAEFVETVEQEVLLKELECDIYQGYYYSKPIPLEELLEFIKRLI